ncbi:hypothetical protein STRTUCAR8_02687 [Streptomyces turgidiscabies Car8]|uniref:Uncharacterized protein n=1 Tax=Streptomyces turgidiscabies (strain Car8) TaxID=698760 RepID=L7FEN0_STRT8|nr:hypothetical protein STRTUCAR8_02687 [Streptomyces turgidiscabies Car8]
MTVAASLVVRGTAGVFRRPDPVVVWGSAQSSLPGQRQVDGCSGPVVDCRSHVRRQKRKPV